MQFALSVSDILDVVHALNEASGSTQVVLVLILALLVLAIYLLKR